MRSPAEQNFGVSEYAIEQAIQARIASPGFFQRVAEEVARGLYPDLANRLVPFGRNTDDKTIRGWPDAQLAVDDSAAVVIEATTDKRAVSAHWPEDLRKLKERLDPGQRGGLVWVCWGDEPDTRDFLAMRAEVTALGVPADRVHIYFRRGLCNQLRKPRYARFWRETLGLTTTAWPFTPIEDVPHLYGRGANSIVPSKQEYADALVHTPSILADVEKALMEKGGALVCGHGASGKTTLAVLLSRRPGFCDGAVYYLDLTGKEGDYGLISSTIETLTTFGDRRTLFVVDNSHLASDFASEIARHWLNLANGSKLLLLARKVHRETLSWKVLPEVTDLSFKAFDLVIGGADLEGAFRRLFQRTHRIEPKAVPSTQLLNWLRLFGGDLVAFSAAVLGRLRDPRWALELSVEDAKEYVHREYLLNQSLHTETEQVLDLAVVGEIEVLLPVEVLRPGGLVIHPRRSGPP